MESISIDTIRFTAGIIAVCFSVLTGSMVVAGTTRASAMDGVRFLARIGLTGEEARSDIDKQADMRLLTLRGLLLSNVKWGMSVICTAFLIMIVAYEYMSPTVRLALLMLLAAHALLVLYEMYWGLTEIAYPPRERSRRR